MREILFRGKRMDNWELIEGDLFQHDDGSAEIFVHKQIAFAGKQLEGRWYKVDPATVGQYTCLTDKNGVKIFEGDILKTTNSNCLTWFVDYKLTSFCANQGNANYSCELGDFMSVSEVEVIGTIHDNPELLNDT